MREPATRTLAILLMLLCSPANGQTDSVFLPINAPNRHSARGLALTGIGRFGLLRKPRPGIPSHYHAGIDIIRPGRNLGAEPVFPIARGRVISKRDDGPFSQLIIEHVLNGTNVWSVYEHVGGIIVGLGSEVDPLVPIARFFSQEELQRFGRQFDHLHLEILRVRPMSLKPDPRHPERRLSPYSLQCRSEEDLQRYYLNPLAFFAASWPEPSP